jgi:hypothetical protein
MMGAGVSVRGVERRSNLAGEGFLHGLLRFARNDAGGGGARRDKDGVSGGVGARRAAAKQSGWGWAFSVDCFASLAMTGAGALREGIMMVWTGVSVRGVERRGYPAGAGFLRGLLRFARNDGGRSQWRGD